MVGGHAVQYYGFHRPTRDLDIWVDTALINAERLVETLKEFGAVSTELSPEVLQHPKRIIRIDFQPLMVVVSYPIIGQRPVSLQNIQGSQPESIEILTLQTGSNFESAYASRIVENLDGVEVSIVSLNTLRAIKGSTNRPNDMQDLIYLNSL